MSRIFIVFVVLIFSTRLSAEEPLKFRWETSHPLIYQVTHSTVITEVAPLTSDGKPETTTRSTKLALTKQWDMKSVGNDGIANITLSVTRMKQEILKPLIAQDGKLSIETIVMDSDSPEGKQEMAAFLNKPILTAKVDEWGNVHEVESASGESAKSRLKAELPFRILLPGKLLELNGTWERTFEIKLDPPLGTGEVHQAVQQFKLRAVRDEYVVIGVTTELKKPPVAAVDLEPLLPWIWEGDLFFEPKSGRYSGAKLTVKKVIKNHRGEGTEFRFTSEYTEALASK